MDFLLNQDELAVLYGLPHLQQLSYLRGIRPYMDVRTGLVGIKRGISYQSIAEQLFVEPQPGIKSQSFSRGQVRRAVAGLVRSGVISVKSEGMHLILKCELATRDFSVQNKADINPSQKASINSNDKFPINKGLLGIESSKADTVGSPKAAIPLKDNNYIYLLSQFEKFWLLYPEKKSRQKALIAFAQLNPNLELFNKILKSLQIQISNYDSKSMEGKWVPPWKYPANWLMQRCWEDETMSGELEGNQNAKHKKNIRKPGQPRDLFCPPSESESESVESNVILFQRR